jgi:subtilisin family serine protease
MRVLLQLRFSPSAHAAVMSGTAVSHDLTFGVSNTTGFSVDPGYPPVQLPGVKSPGGMGPMLFAAAPEFSNQPQDSSYVVRGYIADGPDQAQVIEAITAHPDVLGIFSDPVIESTIICPGAAAVGSDADVGNLLNVAQLQAAGMDGHGVYLAIVDTGINVAHLKTKGRKPKLLSLKSFTPQGVITKPGKHPVDHGTMCAFDAGIAAPKANLLDHAVLLSSTPGTTVMSGLLSDAVLAYSKLLSILNAMPSAKRAMVVSNSWGMFSPAWDFPLGHPGNYSDNPAHPFNVIVATLEAAGADILFAAGNCGRDCPDGRCAFGNARPICGANSHPAVISVAGVDVTKARVGYSSQGPGRLSAQKPDLAAYTHFVGSGVYDADGGTSAACPVAAGVVAAIRSKYPSSRVSPLQLRALLFRTAQDQGGPGFDFDYGWGVIDPAALLTRFLDPIAMLVGDEINPALLLPSPIT